MITLPPLVGVVMGSDSDWAVMQNACDLLTQFGVAFEAQVLSAHRMPDEMFAYADAAHARQMPKGIPVATFAIGEAGAANAALFAVAMLAAGNAELQQRLAEFRAAQTDKARSMRLPI